MSDKDIGRKLDTDRRVAARWRARFLAAGVGGLLQDVTRPGRPRSAREAAKVEEVVRITLEQRPSGATHRSEEHTSELQSLMRISYAVFCLKKKNITYTADCHAINRIRQ